jgi:uncharacterized protein YneF (UPF0154 family)
MTSLEIGLLCGLILGVIACLILGAVIGIKIQNNKIKNDFHTKPLLNERQIRYIYSQAGITPKVKEINRIIQGLKESGGKQ